MKNIYLLSTVLLFALSANSQTQNINWNFDKSHTNVRFSIAHMVVSEVEGNFGVFDGKVSTVGDDFTKSKIDFTIDVNSINTQNEARDKHLKSADFFDTEKYPSIIFKSKIMKKTGERDFELSGDLTMHGVTKPVVLNVKFGGSIIDPYGNFRVGFKITGDLDRTLWGLKYNSILEAGGVTIGETVSITSNIELIKAK
jgi:polyisoprenoid-binding protein YceI